jgi:hypothetical protein
MPDLSVAFTVICGHCIDSAHVRRQGRRTIVACDRTSDEKWAATMHPRRWQAASLENRPTWLAPAASAKSTVTM